MTPTVAELKALRPYACPSALPADWQEALGQAMAADVPQHLRPRGRKAERDGSVPRGKRKPGAAKPWPSADKGVLLPM